MVDEYYHNRSTAFEYDFFGLGCFEANAVNAMSFQSVGVIGFLTVLHLKSR